MKYTVLFVTCAHKKEAHNIATALLTKRLIACANITNGVESFFWWKGRIDHAKESLLAIKTKQWFVKKVEKEIKRLHSYEVPEIIALPVTFGSKEYLRWIDASCLKR